MNLLLNHNVFFPQYGAARMGGWNAADIWEQPIEEEEEEKEEDAREREALEEEESGRTSGSFDEGRGMPSDDDLVASRNALDLSSEDVSNQPLSAPQPFYETDPAPESTQDNVNLVYSTVSAAHRAKKRAKLQKRLQDEQVKAQKSQRRMQERIRKEQRKKEERERRAMAKERRRQAKEASARQGLGLENVVRLQDLDLSTRQGKAQAQFIDAATAAIF